MVVLQCCVSLATLQRCSYAVKWKKFFAGNIATICNVMYIMGVSTEWHKVLHGSLEVWYTVAIGLHATVAAGDRGIWWETKAMST
jgi:hypothetical protein